MKKKQPLNDIIEETMDAGGSLFGGAAYGGAGTFSYAQQSGAKTWAPNSPKFRTSTSDPQGYNVKDIGDEEHLLAHRSPKKLPFPLETINDFLVNAYIQLCNAESQLKTCVKFNAILETNKEKKVLLKYLHRKASALKKMLKNMSEDLDRIAFS